MPNNATHVIVGGVIITGLRLAGALPEEHYVSASALFMFGSGATDLTGFGYVVGARFDGKPFNINIWRPKTWSKKLFEKLDDESWWTLPFHIVHSLFFSVLLLSVLYLITNSELVLWFGSAHLIHIYMDHWTHERSWFWYPFLVEDYSGRDWWKQRFFKRFNSMYIEWAPGLLAIIWHVTEATWYAI